MLPGQEDPDMGSASRQSPESLGKKLLTIRRLIDGGLSQEEMVRRLGLNNELDRSYISLMVDDHKEDISEFEKAAKEANDPDIGPSFNPFYP